MNFETTTCISNENYALLQRYSMKYNMSMTTIIILLMRYAAEYDKAPLKADCKITYRAKEGNSAWKRMHIYLKPNEYEFILDVKKIWKMSVAKVIEFCIDNVLFELEAKVLKKNKTDNYLYNNYHFECGEEDGIKYCLIYWGMPIKILEKFIIPQASGYS